MWILCVQRAPHLSRATMKSGSSIQVWRCPVQRSLSLQGLRHRVHIGIICCTTRRFVFECVSTKTWKKMPSTLIEEVIAKKNGTMLLLSMLSAASMTTAFLVCCLLSWLISKISWCRDKSAFLEKAIGNPSHILGYAFPLHSNSFLKWWTHKEFECTVEE